MTEEQINIKDDEMINLLKEALSDDLWERYNVEEMEEYEHLYAICEKKYKNQEVYETLEAKELLISLWKKDIEIFKKKCKLLGYEDNEINKECEEIISDGLSYLEYDREQYDKIN